MAPWGEPIDLLATRLRAAPIAVLDMEMTGLDPEHDQVCEVAVLRRDADGVVRTLQALVRPDVPMTRGARKVHGLSDEALADAPRFHEVADALVAFLDGAVIVAHNAPFDLSFLHAELARAGRHLDPPVHLDTLAMARRLFAFRRNNLASVCAELGVSLQGAHRALADASATLAVFDHMVAAIDPDDGVTVGELLDLLDALAPNSALRLQQQRLLREGFEGRRTVWIEYQSTDAPQHGVIRREVGVWLLKAPYLQGWCYLRDGERVFRLDRVRTVERGERAYEIPEFRPRI